MKRIRYILAAAMTVPFLLGAPVVLAVQNSTNPGSNNGQTTKTEGSNAVSVAESETETKDNSTLEDRIAQHKIEFKVTLSVLQQERLKLRCKAAQGIVNAVANHAGTNAPERVKHYQEIQDKLTSIIAKLKALGIDTSTLEQEQTTLAGKATQIKNDFTAYKQELNDLRSMDCVADPSGFQSALTAARATHDKLVQEIADIQAYVLNTIKPTLQQLRSQVEAKESSSSSGGNQ